MENSNLLASIPSVKEVMSIWNTDPEILTQSDGEKPQASSEDVSTPMIHRLLNYFLQRTVSGYSHANNHPKAIPNQSTNILL